MYALVSSNTNLGTKMPKNDATITWKNDDATVKILCISLNKFRKSEREKSRMHHKIIIKCIFYVYVFHNLYNPRVLFRAFLFEYIFFICKNLIELNWKHKSGNIQI